ncbi:probable helicase senataxin isoform X2 [Narcine bancroftii]|uniref:probable helicase senataxin isoform X2 n=1 Tax=Narcine bancroftii TaxID=1343680 RepID=UPI0038314880
MQACRMSTCRWCTPQNQTTIEFLHRYSSEKLSQEEQKAANEDLCYCLECVVEYHQARDELPLVQKNLWKIETKRLVEHFEKSLKEEEEEEDDELFLIEGNQEIPLHGYMASNIENDLRVPIIEILKYPYLLLHEHLSELYVEALCKMELGNSSFQIFEKYPGIYILLVHPVETVRKWAILAARSLGKVERDDFYDLQEVITCLLKVIELDLFENTDLYNSSGMEEGKLFLLPPHLYDVTNEKNYWLGICMLLMVLDEQAMDSLLLAHDKQNDFMKSILSIMMKSKPGDASDPFWPALQCFMVILDRLGSKVWGHLIDPTEAFQAIIGSESYNNEIEKIRNSRRDEKLKYDLDGDDHDAVVSCSQIVYDYDTRKQSKDISWKHTTCAEYYPNMYDEMQSLAQVLQCDIGQDMRVHNSTFLWFIPFVNSVMDLEDHGIAYIGEVVHHLYSEIKDVLNRKIDVCDKVTEFFILILVSIIEIHRNKNYLHLLWFSSQKWVEALVKCANLPARVFNQNSERTAGTSNIKGSSTILSVTSSVCSSITNSVQQSCVQLIRSFLKEGCHSQQRSTFQQFLDKLNLQLRSTFILGWQLSLREQQELKSCLIQLVKNAKCKTQELRQLGTVGKGSAHKYPLIKHEKEDAGEWGKMPGYSNSGPGPPCSLFQTNIKSSIIQKSRMNQGKMAVCKGQVDQPKESCVDGIFSCKAEFSMCQDGTFLNETRIVEENISKVDDAEKEISPLPSPTVEKVIMADVASRQGQTLEQADVNFTVGSSANDNIQVKPLEETPDVHHKEKWKQSMLTKFQKSLNDNITNPDIASTVNDQNVNFAVIPSPADACNLPQKMKSIETTSCKFKISPNRLLNLKVKIREVNMKRKLMKKNNSLGEQREVEKSSTVGIDNNQFDYMNNRNHEQNVDASKRTIGGSTNTELVKTSQFQIAPFTDKREKLTDSDDLILCPLSLDKANSSNTFKDLNQCTSIDSDCDDIPLIQLREKLKKMYSLTREENADDSKMKKDPGITLKVASEKRPNVSNNLFKEVEKIKTLNKIERKVNYARQKMEKSDSAAKEPTIDKGVSNSNSQSAMENINMLKVERCETKNQVDATIDKEIADSTGKNQTCPQEIAASSKSSPTMFEECDSQIFEFESEEQIYSCWQDVPLHVEPKGEVEKPDQDNQSDVQTSSDNADICDIQNEWGYDTDYVPDELIEKVAEEVKDQLKKEITLSKSASTKLGVKQILCSSAGEGTSVSCSRDFEKMRKNCIKITSNPSSSGSLSLSDKLVPAKFMSDVQLENKQARKIADTDEGTRSKNGIRKNYLSQVHSKKGLNKFILTKQSTNGRLDQKATKKRSYKAEKTSSQTLLTNASKSNVMQMNLPATKLPSTPPPKKVRKRPEPTSTVEKLGLKKKTRKALDLSQRSLDHLSNLRNYGQVVGTVEGKHLRKAKFIVPPKLTKIRNPHLLASQDLQYFRQSRPRQQHKEKIMISAADESVFQKGPLPSTGMQGSAICVQTSEVIPSTSLESSHSYTAANMPSLEREINTTLTEGNVSSVNVSDDLNLTQHDPLDMDISADENEEDDLSMLTQRDPIDMDIDSDTLEDSTIKPSSSNIISCQYRRCTDIVMPSEKFCKNHAASEPKDAKPGLPQSDLKSSRPYTTKCFASSSTSRNAQLATEMEIIPKRPTPMVSKVQQFQKPPPVKFAVPQTSKPIQPVKVVESNVLHTQNKDVNFKPKSHFHTPVAMSSSKFDPFLSERQASPGIEMRDHHQWNQSYLINAVLKWTYQMFDMFEQFGAPDMLCEFPPREVPERFGSYEDYFKTFYPLLMLNLFEQLAQKLMEFKQTPKMIQNHLKLKNYYVEGRVNRAEFQALLHDHELVKQLHPKEDDVVFLWLPQRCSYYIQDGSEMTNDTLIPHIAYVSRSSRSGRDSQTSLYLSIRTRGNVSAIENQPVRCDVIGSIVTTIRQFKGLLFLAKIPLMTPILSAHPSFFNERDIMESAKWSNAKDYNGYQQKAINVALSMVKRTRIPKVCIIQGPPGTGKSKTIVGLLHCLLNKDEENVHPSYSRSMRSKRTRVLVCAPSNAAIDDLMKKIIIDFKQRCKDVKNCLGNCGDVNLIRLGAEKSISSDVRGFSLDQQVNRRIKKGQFDADQVIQKQKDWLDRKLDELGKQCAIIKKDSEQIEQIIQERRKLERERAELGRKLKEVQGRTRDIQLNIILESHIICCTLSTSGNVLLEMSFRKLGHEPFSCVIVDEKAKELNYGQSMMYRLQKCLQNEVNRTSYGHSPVLMLLTQYRMHPDICFFPSKYIYGNMLKTDKKVEMERCQLNWPFQSYMLFDVIDGCEHKEKDSYTNPQEVKLVIALIHMIAEKQKGFCRNIGVITPYNAQKEEIIKQIEQECKRARLNHDKSVQVGTVDGFQGCEKDCVIVSCVRANSLPKSIGFLADRQRMNVTITRARCSLFILGHLKTLVEDKDWNALIQDANKRGAIVKTCEREYLRDCQKITKPRLIYHRTVSDPSTRKSERESACVLKKSRTDDSSFKTVRSHSADNPIPKSPIPSQPTALHQQSRPKATVAVQLEASNTVTQPLRSVRPEQSAWPRHRDPRLARKDEALLKEVQPQLKTNQSLSKSHEVMPEDSSTSR